MRTEKQTFRFNGGHKNVYFLRGRGESMKFYFVHYRTYDGEHEYVEYGIFASRSYEIAEKRAVKGKRFFTRYAWEEFCQYAGIQEIPAADFEVLKKYFINI